MSLECTICKSLWQIRAVLEYRRSAEKLHSFIIIMLQCTITIELKICKYINYIRNKYKYFIQITLLQLNVDTRQVWLCVAQDRNQVNLSNRTNKSRNNDSSAKIHLHFPLTFGDWTYKLITFIADEVKYEVKFVCVEIIHAWSRAKSKRVYHIGSYKYIR